MVYITKIDENDINPSCFVSLNMYYLLQLNLPAALPDDIRAMYVEAVTVHNNRIF
jgi:hypothetical protein